MKKVLLITNIQDEAKSVQREYIEQFAAGVYHRNPEISMSFCAVQELVFSLLHGTISVRWKGQELREHFDIVHLRNADKFPDYANAVRVYCEAARIPLINMGDAVVPFFGKVSQGFLFGLHGVNTPDLISAPRNSVLLAQLETMPYPFILKHNNGMKGKDNYLIKNRAELEAVLSGDKHGFVAQPFIANEGELRVLVFGQTAKPLIFKKTATQGTHLNNTSQGGSAEKVGVEQVDKSIIEASYKVARETNRELAGVDVLLGKDGNWYILEINATPSLASGALLDEKCAHYADYIASIKTEGDERS